METVVEAAAEEAERQLPRNAALHAASQKGAEQLGRSAESAPSVAGWTSKLHAGLPTQSVSRKPAVFGALQAGLTANGLSGSHERAAGKPDALSMTCPGWQSCEHSGPNRRLGGCRRRRTGGGTNIQGDESAK